MYYLWLDYRRGSGRWAETRVCHGSSQPSHAFLWQQLMGMAGNLCEVSLAWFSLQLHLSSRHPFAWIVASSSSSAFFFSFAGGNSWSTALGGGGVKSGGFCRTSTGLYSLYEGCGGGVFQIFPHTPQQLVVPAVQEKVPCAVCSASSQGGGRRQNHLHVRWFGWPCLVLRIPNMVIAFVVSLTSVCVCILSVVWVKQAKKSYSLCIIWTVRFFCI